MFTKDKIVSGRRILEFLEQHQLPISIFARDKLVERFPYLEREFLKYYEEYRHIPAWNIHNESTRDV